MSDARSDLGDLGSLPDAPDQHTQLKTDAPDDGLIARRAPDTLSGLWRVHCVWLGILAYLLALAGTLLLKDEQWRAWSTLLLVGGAALAVMAWYDRPRADASDLARVQDRILADSRRLLCLAGFAAASLLAVLAGVQYLANAGEKFGLAGWLWLTSIGLLLVSAVMWLRPATETQPAAHDRPSHSAAPWTAWEVVVFVLLIALAAGLRLWNLRDFPEYIYGDEIVTGRIAIDSYLAGPGPAVFSTLWSGNELPALWFLLVARSLELGGMTLSALRLPAALFGAAMIVPFYALVRLAWGRTSAIAGSAILAFSASNIHYSRITLNNIVAPFFWAVCFFFLLRGVRSRRPVDWALAGLAGGLSEYGYYGTRLLPFVLIGFSLYLLVIHRHQAAHYLKGIALLALGYLIGFGPLLAHFISHPQLYLGRGASMLRWDHIPTSLQDLQLMWSTLWPAMADNLLGISARASQDIMYFAPLLLPAEAALLVLGVALLIWRWRHPASFLMLLSGLGVLVVGGTLVRYAEGELPYMAHWTPAFPAFYAAMAAPLGYWADRTGAELPRRLRWIAPGVLVGGLLVLAWLNVTFYFRDYYADGDVVRSEVYRTAQRGLELRSAQARYQATLGPDYVVRLVGPTTDPNNPDVEYLVRGQDWAIMPDPEVELPRLRARDKGLAFLFLPQNEGYRGLVRTYFPGGVQGEVRNRAGRLLFYTYVITQPWP